jgi:hypothetical protein
MRKLTACPSFSSSRRSAETRPSKRMLRGSMTLTSSLPICAVSPAEALRSLTTPAKGARTSVRSSCWRAATTRARAAASSLCVALRRTSASSSACIEVMPWACRVFSRCTMRSACTKAWFDARSDSSADARASRSEVSSSRISKLAGLDRLAVVPQHLHHHRRHLGAQVGTACRLHRARDHRALGQPAGLQGAQILGREQQRRWPAAVSTTRCATTPAPPTTSAWTTAAAGSGATGRSPAAC